MCSWTEDAIRSVLHRSLIVRPSGPQSAYVEVAITFTKTTFSTRLFSASLKLEPPATQLLGGSTWIEIAYDLI